MPISSTGRYNPNNPNKKVKRDKATGTIGATGTMANKAKAKQSKVSTKQGATRGVPMKTRSLPATGGSNGGSGRYWKAPRKKARTGRRMSKASVLW